MEYFSGGIGYDAWRDFAISLALIGGAVLVGLAIHWVLFGILSRLIRRTRFGWDDIALRHARAPARLLLPLLLVNLIAPTLNLPGASLRLLSHITSLLLILVISYVLSSAVRFLRELFLFRYDVTQSDNLKARMVHTQIGVLEKVVMAIIVVLTAAFMLMTFEGVRQVGVSLLASAGIAGIILGFAAQKSIGNLLAGIQLALTQPIRIDDVVIVENEWGRIEEITLTYVVVRIWDLRRLVVPITYFIEHPFQNWTRLGSGLLGSVFIYTDYTVPVGSIRQELDRLVKPHPLWDGEVCVLHVTDAKPDSLEIRLLMSTRNSGDGWDLRCHVREKMVDFIQKNYPESLPRVRAEVTRIPGGSPEGDSRENPSGPVPERRGNAGGAGDPGTERDSGKDLEFPSTQTSAPGITDPLPHKD